MATDIQAVASRKRRPRVNDPEFAAFVLRLREAMKDAGLDPDGRDQTKLEKASGVSQDIISRGLGQRRRPSSPKARALALALNVMPAWLEWGDEPKRAAAPAREPGSDATLEDIFELALDAARKGRISSRQSDELARPGEHSGRHKPR